MLLSEAEPGGRAFLAAVPAGPKRMEPAVFTAELRHRLGVAEASSDGWCPRCDSVLDTFSLHAGVCIAGGERNQRHNALRDLLCTWADRAGLHPEKEKPGFPLPQRPEETGVARRRPADIFAPCFSGKPTALDLAVTGFQRQANLAEAGRQGGAAALLMQLSKWPTWTLLRFVEGKVSPMSHLWLRRPVLGTMRRPGS